MYKVVKSYPYFLIYRKGCNIPLPFNFIKCSSATSLCYQLEKGNTTVMQEFYYDRICGYSPIGTKSKSFPDWAKENLNNFKQWEL